MFRRAILLAFVMAALPAAAAAQAPVTYRLSFPAPEHRWMQVEAIFPDLPAGALELHMSRSSPGRYALHEFAKNVYDVSATDPDGRTLDLTRSDPSTWVVSTHGAAVAMKYKVYGDRIDGTYLAVD